MGLTPHLANQVIELSKRLGIGFDTNTADVVAEATSILEDAKKYSRSSAEAKEIWQTFGSLLDNVEITNKVVHKFLYQEEELPVPKYLEIDKVPEMPTDLTICSEQEIRKLHSEFHAYQIRTNWLIAQQEAEVAAQKNAKTQLYNGLLMKTDLLMPADGNRARKEKTKMILDAEINQNENLAKITDKLNSLETDLNFLKTLRDIYESNCNRLSRESSMRFSEVKHSGSM